MYAISQGWQRNALTAKRLVWGFLFASAERGASGAVTVGWQQAQVEELRDPQLRTVPLGVTQKYLVVTCNYVARAAGVCATLYTQAVWLLLSTTHRRERLKGGGGYGRAVFLGPKDSTP